MSLSPPHPTEKPVCGKCWLKLHQKLDNTKTSMQKKILEPLDFCVHGVHVKTSIPEECTALCHTNPRWLIAP